MDFAKKSLCVFVACMMLATNVLGQHDMPKVVGGTLVPAPLPYQVSLFSGSTHFCGGALISRQTVVTAASCFTSAHLTQPPNVGVLAGSITGLSTADGVTQNVFSIDIHPNYNDTTRANDIAVVTLRLPFNNSLTTIAPLALGSTAVPIQTECRVSGWGGRSPAELFSGELHTLNIHIVDPSIQCVPIYAALPDSFNFITESQVCARPVNNDQGVCTTDQGGPLVCNNVLSGVLSWGLHCTGGNPAVFTNNIPFNSWIETTRTLRENQAGNGAETAIFSSVFLSILILLNTYLSL